MFINYYLRVGAHSRLVLLARISTLPLVLRCVRVELTFSSMYILEVLPIKLTPLKVSATKALLNNYGLKSLKLIEIN